MNYNEACNRGSDINELLPVLYKYGLECNHITEFGVRSVVSTYAWIEANCSVIRAYDIDYHPNMEEAKNMANNKNIDLQFIIKNDLEANIEKTEILFIDTLHNYEQLKAELNMHSDKASKFIILHDVYTFGHKGETSELGLLKAVFEFLKNHNEWKIEEFLFNNNGLLILKRN